MKEKPLAVKLIALGYVLNPLFFIFQYFYFSGVSFSDAATWQSLLSPYKLLCFIILPPIVGYGIYRIRVWGWYLFLGHSFFIISNNTLAYLVGSRTPAWAIIIFTLVTFVIVAVFVHSAVRAPYFNPRYRWWESKPRFAVTLDVEMTNADRSLQGETFNISEGGFFMVNSEAIHIGEEYRVQLAQNGQGAISGLGRVVWVNPPGEKLPQGFGVMFTELDEQGKKLIQDYVQQQKKSLQGEETRHSSHA